MYLRSQDGGMISVIFGSRCCWILWCLLYIWNSYLGGISGIKILLCLLLVRLGSSWLSSFIIEWLWLLHYHVLVVSVVFWVSAFCWSEVLQFFRSLVSYCCLGFSALACWFWNCLGWIMLLVLFCLCFSLLGVISVLAFQKVSACCVLSSAWDMVEDVARIVVLL